jgi:hypothetical protein
MRENCAIFTFTVTNVQNVHHKQQCIVENDVQQIGRHSLLLLMKQQHMQFQFHASGVCSVRGFGV